MSLRFLTSCFLGTVLLLSNVQAHKHCDHRLARRNGGPSNSEDNKILDSQSLFTRPANYPVTPLIKVSTANGQIETNTTSVADIKVTALRTTADSVDGTALILARTSAEAYSGYSGLNDRGIPYQVLIVPKEGVKLPQLNSSATHGNFGMIVVIGEASYDYGTSGYESAITAAQWQQLYNYQVAFGVRMVRLDVNPGPSTGTISLGSCCTGEQYVYISNATAFPNSGLKTGLAAGISTSGLYHYPAKISNASIATEFLAFAAASNATADPGFSTVSTAGVINNINGRQQMVFFMPFATDWAYASVFLQATWISWATRGLYAGYRRIMLNTQIDDMFLETPMFNTGINYRVTATDVYHHISVMNTINTKLASSNPGSSWMIEVGHNGNGNIEASNDLDTTGYRYCGVGPVEYPDQIDTPLEFAKPPGTGKSLYPATPVNYPNYTLNCMQLDALLTFWQTPAYGNKFAHISHTFTHEDENNSTYADVYKELTWNQGWLKGTGIDQASNYSPLGIIPPAITGLHNGDALQAWADAGIQYVVGDNTRSVLLNSENEHWPLISTLESNGYAGMQISPRWATNFYYNCDLSACVLAEWKNVSKGVGDFYTIVTNEIEVNARHLLGLHHDAFMFHQANLRYVGADSYYISSSSTTRYTMSLFELWVTIVTNEISRLVTWPIISQKHDDFSVSFKNRMARDQCNYKISWKLNVASQKITTVTLTSDGNTCSVPIPLTVPGQVTDTQDFTTEQIGNDPLTIWVTLTGDPVTFTLSTPISV